jgi:catechol 2,3-dioxygenase-like lactoylglutathione lyase family enzyme
MGIRGVSHVAVGVRDMDRSLAFYRDVIGLKVRFDDTEEFSGGSSGKFPSIKRRGVYLEYGKAGDDSFIVLDQQMGQEPFGEPAQLFQVGIHHFGFWVDDIDEIAERAQAGGFRILTGPGDADTIHYGEAPGKTVRSMFLYDPDGNSVQCDQRAPEDW